MFGKGTRNTGIVVGYPATPDTFHWERQELEPKQASKQATFLTKVGSVKPDQAKSWRASKEQAHSRTNRQRKIDSF